MTPDQDQSRILSLNAPSAPLSSNQPPRCRLCKKPIELGAIKCTECDGYQNWRRYFDFSSVILSLLVALFSVLTVAVPVIVHVFTSERSDVGISEIARDRDSITLICANRGNKTAIVYLAELLSADGGKWSLKLPEAKLVLHPDDVEVLTLKPSIGDNEVPFPEAAEKIEFHLVPFGGERESSLVSKRLK